MFCAILLEDGLSFLVVGLGPGGPELKLLLIAQHLHLCLNFVYSFQNIGYTLGLFLAVRDSYELVLDL